MLLHYILIVLSASLFIYGFFPVSTPFIKINNDPPSYVNNFSLNGQTFYSTNISKTVLVIIDALRLDFVDTNYMPKTTKLMQLHGCFNKIKVEIPTVTLPRIKAITVGNIPQFTDIVMNLASTEILEDSIIHSALKSGKKIVFYGDDTWLKLFPNKFSRFEGTTSFFVRDFKEVDDNVTRNVYIELANDDWDIMILHYLGLDHIGHVYGPFSSFIPPKLKEMDDIVHKIFETILSTNENALLMVTGDHGMKDSGGHGGSTFYETHVPLVIIGHNCKNNSINQGDIPVNLAVLLGLPIPSLAIGKIHKSLLMTNLEKYLYALYYNSFLLKQKDFCCDGLYKDATAYYLEFLIKANQSDALKAVNLFETYLNVVNNNLAQSSAKQNLISLFIALLIMINTLLSFFVSFFCLKQIDKFHVNKILMLSIIFIQFIIGDNLKIVSFIMFIILNLILLNNIRSIILLVSSFTHIINFFMIVIVCHPITFLSSSFIEEEHQFWYFVHVLLMNFQILYFSKMKSLYKILISLVCLVSFRLLRTLNSTGDKWANYPDTSDWFLKDENLLVYQTLHAFSLSLVFLVQYFICKRRKLVISFLVVILIFILKQNESNFMLGKIIWLLIFLQLIFSYSKLVVWILIISLLLKPYNVILVPYCVLSSLHFSKHFHSTENVVFYHVLLGNALYFAQGHSNSLASIDVSIGYAGLSEYLPIVVVGQVLCHTYAFPILCHLLIFHTSKIEMRHVFSLLFCHRLYILFVISIVTFIFRYHLFIWSVFAPKLFIEFIHVLVLFVEYVIIVVFQSILKKFSYVKIKNVFY
ncbi:GPI ethanolamine phosphate transferase 2 [Diorhabda sublineata]|uniref:GPI ethanolamine phosphate transferase 2 n=1 Tax=Diorhabda sublineata TaxID=1163346 RepID=UPI0024E08E1C|nr:GPI ethanolamine phosphate transferase 2 [Diorhabda sublineata]